MEDVVNIYCDRHRLRFKTNLEEKILCEIGRHELSRHFPYSESWRFCCDCQTFYSALLAGSKKCPNCSPPKEISQSYLCHKCLTLCIESDENTPHKPYYISENKIEPFCPGCRTAAGSTDLSEHKCKLGIDFFTSRQVCPFCDSGLVNLIYPSASESENVNKIYGKKARFDKLTSLLIEEKGESWSPFIIVKDKENYVAQPILDRFLSGTFETIYQDIYFCFSLSKIGKVDVIKPAVVEKADGGWKLLSKGVLKIERDIEESGSEEPLEIETDFEEELVAKESKEQETREAFEEIEQADDQPADQEKTVNNDKPKNKNESNQVNSTVSCFGCLFLMGIVIIFFIIVGWLASSKKPEPGNDLSPPPTAANQNSLSTKTPAATPLVSPTPNLTPTPSRKSDTLFESKDEVDGVIINDDTEIFSNPTRDSELLTTVPSDTELKVIKRKNPNSPWYQVLLPDTTKGWVDGNNFECVPSKPKCGE